MLQTHIDELMYSSEYADYIMENGDPSEITICDGDSLTLAQESGYLFSEFLKSIGVQE